MKDLNALKKSVLSTGISPKYFETGRYTARVISVDYVERDDKDDLMMFKFFIEDCYPESKNGKHTHVLWGKKINENNILDISDAICQIAGEDIDLNKAVDTQQNVSPLRNKLVNVDVTESTWNGKPFFTVRYNTHESVEQLRDAPKKDIQWGDPSNPPWNPEPKPF
jgi:hypothetical protein